MRARPARGAHRRQAAGTGRGADSRTACTSGRTWHRAAGRGPAQHDRFLPLAAARDISVAVGYLPGSAMRKAAQLLPGDAKMDARDAYVIAFTALHMPDTLRDCNSDDETMAPAQGALRFRRRPGPGMQPPNRPAA